MDAHDWFEERPLAREQQVNAAVDRLRTKVAGALLTGPDVAALQLVLGELGRMQHVITEYAEDVADGARFDALLGLVPGLASDDGVYGDV